MPERMHVSSKVNRILEKKRSTGVTRCAHQERTAVTKLDHMTSVASVTFAFALSLRCSRTFHSRLPRLQRLLARWDVRVSDKKETHARKE